MMINSLWSSSYHLTSRCWSKIMLARQSRYKDTIVTEVSWVMMLTGRLSHMDLAALFSPDSLEGEGHAPLSIPRHKTYLIVSLGAPSFNYTAGRQGVIA